MWPNLDWNDLIQGLVPQWWRKPYFVRWLHVMVSPVREMHALFLEERERVLYEMSFTGQTLSLEGALNDRFDPDDRGIYIDNASDPVVHYIYRKVEAQPPIHLYKKWVAEQVYLAGQFTISKGGVWEAVNDNSASGPSLVNPNWSYVGPLLYLRRKEELQNEFDFIVMVPVAVVYNESEMRALINRYRIAPKRYTIITY